MNENQKEISYICNDILDNNDLKVSIIFNQDYKCTMYYDLDKDHIAINEVNLKDSSNNYNMSFTEYVRIIFSHELGHFLDNELKGILNAKKEAINKLKKYHYYKENSEIQLEKIRYNTVKAEENAWRIAESILSEDECSIRNFCTVKNDSLDNAKKIAELEQYKLTLLIENAENSKYL